MGPTTPGAATLRPVRAAAALVLVVLGTACTPAPETGPTAPSSPSPSQSDTSDTSDTSDAPEAAGTPGATVRTLRIEAGGQRLTATLDESAASRDLVAQLPLELEMTDHGSVEKTGRLPRPLSTAGQPPGADPAPGDLGYYEPGGDLVLYYGDQGYFDGIVRLGTLSGDLDALADAGTVAVRLEPAG